MSIDTVKEGTTSFHPFSVEDYDGLAVIPESIRYKIMSGNSVQVADWVDIPSNSTQIVISADKNIITNDNKERYITVEVTYGSGKKITDDIVYRLVDVKGI